MTDDPALGPALAPVDITATEAVFAVAAALFVYSFFRMSVRLWQFLTYDRSFGAVPKVSIDDLVALADAADRDLPGFSVMVPAWNETDTIAATMRRLARVNYPASLLDIIVITYADEPPGADGETTGTVACRVAAEINGAARREQVRVERVPAGFDGYFPGAFDGGERHVGKARGLNYALRRLHERITADERAFALGRSVGLGLEAPTRDDADLPDFLRPIAEEVETRAPATLAGQAAGRLADLDRTRPRLAAQIGDARDPGRIAELSHRLNARWVAVFDADSDAPLDLFRHLAARILVDPTVMGFQGPVAPLANFDDVHPICGMAGLWIAFSHATGFPRLMTRPGWARPLAGTNWCMRIEGYEADGRLTRHPVSSGARLRRHLYFDPRQLTEDLEAALRLYSDWRLAADWHPSLEWEQAAPRPRDLIGQWRRWTLGTLQAMSGMLRSTLPWRQKLSLALVPVDILATGLGPALTIVLWTIILTSGVAVDPALLPLTVFLTGVNVLYAAPFILTRHRFRRLRRMSLAGEELLSVGAELAHMPDLAVPVDTRTACERIGLRDDRDFVPFARAYLDTRCLDPDRPDRGPIAQAYLADSPGAIDLARYTALLGRIEAARPPGAPRWTVEPLREAAHTLFWALPFLLFQLIPFYSGFTAWVLGRERSWTKTARTPKR